MFEGLFSTRGRCLGEVLKLLEGGVCLKKAVLEVGLESYTMSLLLVLLSLPPGPTVL